MFQSDLSSGVLFDAGKLTEYGFKEKEGCLVYECTIHKDFKATYSYRPESGMSGSLFDLSFGDEYILPKTEKRTAFAEELKAEYEKVLEDIISRCGSKGSYGCHQANRFDAFLMENFNPLREFPFQDYPSFGTYKNQDGKWFAIIMNVPYRKLSMDKDGEAFLVNFKITPTEELMNTPGICPAYHMSKKNWITVLLDDTLEDDVILELAKESYQNVLNKKRK